MKNNKRNKTHKPQLKPLPRNIDITPDEAVLNLLQRSSADLSKERLIHFYLYFPAQEKARMAEEELMNLGFSTECDESSYNGENWLCLASKNLVPDYRTLTKVRKKLEYIARNHDGKYDGWETELGPEEVRGLPNI